MSDHGCNATPETLESWDAYLGDFFAKVYPVFLKHGVARDTAFLAWVLNVQKNAIESMADSMDRGVDEGEDWKRDRDE